MQTNIMARSSNGLGSKLGLATLLLSALAVGCGGENAVNVPRYPVSGKVLLADGKPLTSGKVIFVQKGGVLQASGALGADGSYKLGTTTADDGAPAGEYKIKIEPAYENMPAGKKSRSNLPFASKYLDEDGSTLTATVKAEPTEVPPIQLK